MATPLSSLTTPDGLALHLRRWPGPADARGTLLIVHGLGEHGGRHAWLATQLQRAGWHVLSYDQRGHGRSDGPRGRLACDDSLLTDLSRVLDIARAEHGGPLLLFGHSLGGLVASRFVAEGTQALPAAWAREVDGLVLSSPALAVNMSAVQKALLAVLARLAPDIAVPNGLKPEWLSRDSAVVAAYNADPLVHDRLSPRLARFIQDSGPWVRACAPAWRVPTLLLYAGSDRCVAPAGSDAFAATTPHTTSQRFDPLFHEIFNEPERDAVFAALQVWVDARWPAVRG